MHVGMEFLPRTRYYDTLFASVRLRHMKECVEGILGLLCCYIDLYEL
jgi:hypothetical protein